MLVVLGLVALGCALRVVGLSTHSLWLDETMSTYLARSQDLVERLTHDRHPPLYFLLLGVWMEWFGDSESALRSLSATLSCLALAAFAALAPRLLHPRAACWAIALAAVSPFSVWYAQEVRGYALIEFSSVVGLLGAQRCLAGGRPFAHAALVALACALAFGTHYVGGLLAIAVASLAAVERWRGQAGARPFAALLAASTLGMLVWVPWLVRMVPRQMSSTWGALALISPRDLGELPVRLFLVDVDVLPQHWRWVGWVLGILILAGLALCVREALRGQARAFALLAALLVPVAAAYAITRLITPFFGPRYLIAVEPVACLSVGLGLGSIPWRWTRCSAGFVLLAGCAAMTVLHKLENRKEDFRDACAHVAASWRPGDAVVSVTGTEPGFSESPLLYYLRERPEIAASLVDERELLLRRGSLPRGLRIHVVFRDAPYSRSALQGLMEVTTVDYQGPDRNRVRYLRLKKI